MKLHLPRAGDDARTAAARAIVDAREANRRLVDDGAFYTDVERDFGAGKPR